MKPILRTAQVALVSFLLCAVLAVSCTDEAVRKAVFERSWSGTAR